MADKRSQEDIEAARFAARLQVASRSAHGTLAGILREARGTLAESDWAGLVRAFALAIDGPASPFLSPLTAWSEAKASRSADRFFGEVLAELDLKPEAMVGLVVAACEREPTADRWTILSAFERWCSARRGRARASIGFILGAPNRLDLLGPALRAGLARERAWHLSSAFALLEDAGDAAAVIAFEVLAADAKLAQSQVDRVLDRVEARVPGLSDRDAERVFDAAIRLALRARPNRVAALLTLVRPGMTAAAKQAAANRLAFAEAMPDPVAAQAMLDFLIDDAPIEPLVADLLDDALARWLPQEEAAPLYSSALLVLLDREEIGWDCLDSCAHAIQAMEPARRDGLLGRLLAEGGFAGCEAVAALSHRSLRKQVEPTIDFAPYALEAERALVITRRVVGLLALAPETAIAILLSMMRTGPAAAREEIERLILDPILFSYWDEGRACLERWHARAAADMQAVIERLLGALERYVADIRETGFIDELFPSEANRYLAALKRAAEAREINRQATEASVLASIMPMRLILNGDSAIFRVFDGEGSGKRAEQEMRAQEFSQALPRLDAVDPFGFWYRRRLMINGRSV